MDRVLFAHDSEWEENVPPWCSMTNISCGAEAEKSSYHFHDHDQYYLIARGNMRVMLDQQLFRARKGDVVAIPYGSHHRIVETEPECLYTVINDRLIGQQRIGCLPSPDPKPFIGIKGRYVDGNVCYYDVPANRCAIVPERTWFWLKQKPQWSRILAFGVMELHGDSVPDYHEHDYYEVYICMHGTIEVFADGKSYCMEKGDMMAIPEHCPHMLVRTPNDAILAFFNGEPFGKMRYGHMDHIDEE